MSGLRFNWVLLALLLGCVVASLSESEESMVFWPPTASNSPSFTDTEADEILAHGTRLFPPFLGEDTAAGAKLCVDGSFMAMSAYGGDQRDSVHVYRLSGGTWVPLQTISFDYAAYDCSVPEFGKEMSLKGDMLAVMAREAGFAFIYQFDASADQFEPFAQLPVSWVYDGETHMAIEGSLCVISGENANFQAWDLSVSPPVMDYVRSETGQPYQWGRIVDLALDGGTLITVTASRIFSTDTGLPGWTDNVCDNDEAPGFYNSIINSVAYDAQSDVLAIGEPQCVHPISDTEIGCVHVYRHSTGALLDTVYAPIPMNDSFGQTVEVKGRMLTVGRSLGPTTLWRLGDDDKMHHLSDLVLPDDMSSHSLGISDTYVFIGSTDLQYSPLGSPVDIGGAYVYQFHVSPVPPITVTASLSGIEACCLETRVTVTVLGQDSQPYTEQDLSSPLAAFTALWEGVTTSVFVATEGSGDGVYTFDVTAPSTTGTHTLVFTLNGSVVGTADTSLVPTLSSAHSEVLAAGSVGVPAALMARPRDHCGRLLGGLEVTVDIHGPDGTLVTSAALLSSSDSVTTFVPSSDGVHSVSATTGGVTWESELTIESGEGQPLVLPEGGIEMRDMSATDEWLVQSRVKSYVDTDSAVHVYRKVAGIWVLHSTLFTSPALNALVGTEEGRNYSYGHYTAIDEATLVVSSPDEALPAAYTGSGSVHVYEYDSVTDVWVNTEFLRSPDWYWDDQFGSSLAISGDLLVVGGDDSTYVYERDGSGNWVLLAELLDGDTSLGASSVDIIGTTVAVALPYCWVGDISKAGSVLTYDLSSFPSGWNTTPAIIVSPTLVPNIKFASAMSLSSVGGVIRAIVAEEGSSAVHTYVLDNSWEHESTVMAPDGNYNFGGYLALFGDVALASLSNSQVLVLHHSDGEWTVSDTLLPVGGDARTLAVTATQLFVQISRLGCYTYENPFAPPHPLLHTTLSMDITGTCEVPVLTFSLLTDEDVVYTHDLSPWMVAGWGQSQDLRVTHLGSGEYTLTAAAPSIAGEHTLFLYLDGTEVGRTEPAMLADVTSLSLSTVSVPEQAQLQNRVDVTVSIVSTCSLLMSDADVNVVVVGPSALEVLNSAASLTLDNTYSVSFTPDAEGTYTVTATVDGAPLANSAQMHVSATRVEHDGVTYFFSSSSVFDGCPTYTAPSGIFTTSVTLLDAAGVPVCEELPLEWDWGDSSGNSPVFSEQDCVYAISPIVPNDLATPPASIIVSLGNTVLLTSPVITVGVPVSDTLSGDTVWVTGAVIASEIDDSTCASGLLEFTLEGPEGSIDDTYDVSHALSVRWDSASVIAVSVSATPRTYTASYASPGSEGEHTLSVCIGDVVLASQTIALVGQVSAASPVTAASYGRVGDAFDISVQVQDECGLPRAGDTVEYSVGYRAYGATEDEVVLVEPVTVTESTGLVQLSYTPGAEGIYMVSAVVNDVILTQVATTKIGIKVMDGTQSVYLSSNLSTVSTVPSALPAGTPFDVSVSLRSLDGELVLSESLYVTVAFGASSVAMTLVGDTYTGTVTTPSLLGSQQLSVLVEGVTVSQEPDVHVVMPLKDGSGDEVFVSEVVFLHTDEDMGTCQEMMWSFEIHGLGGPVTVDLCDSLTAGWGSATDAEIQWEEGIYSLTYDTPSQPGTHTLTVQAEGTVLGSVSVEVSTRVSVALSVLGVPTQGVVGDVHTISLSLLDTCGTPVAVADDILHTIGVSVAFVDGIAIDVNPLSTVEEGVYTAHWTPRRCGAYTWSAAVDGVLLGDTPTSYVGVAGLSYDAMEYVVSDSPIQGLPTQVELGADLSPSIVLHDAAGEIIRHRLPLEYAWIPDGPVLEADLDTDTWAYHMASMAPDTLTGSPVALVAWVDGVRVASAWTSTVASVSATTTGSAVLIANAEVGAVSVDSDDGTCVLVATLYETGGAVWPEDLSSTLRGGWEYPFTDAPRHDRETGTYTFAAEVPDVGVNYYSVVSGSHVLVTREYIVSTSVEADDVSPTWDYILAGGGFAVGVVLGALMCIPCCCCCRAKGRQAAHAEHSMYSREDDAKLESQTTPHGMTEQYPPVCTPLEPVAPMPMLSEMPGGPMPFGGVSGHSTAKLINGEGSSDYTEGR
ncbi:hypothetical protein KIPB_000168 [Kipferlia bialata]|uniref:Uncharacterized protein n=1 Tax=Kipferlia bialata TaxID=797122 RepID=A0A391NNG4_9EUKA|nr:hypothetical protein KIPB_000168 [Kipferlia bialata]|eukprot:g168.t1